MASQIALKIEHAFELLESAQKPIIDLLAHVRLTVEAGLPCPTDPKDLVWLNSL